MDQLPPMMDYDIRHGRTYMYFKGKPLFPFGYGLSYTSFSYSNLRFSAPELKADGAVTISLDLANSGQRQGDEVAQLYVGYPESKVERPLKQLKNFKRLALKPGETQTLDFVLKGSDLAYWDDESAKPGSGKFQGSWKIEPGKIEVWVGSSSEDVRLKGTVEIAE
jgi:beta-glucosidase